MLIYLPSNGKLGINKVDMRQPKIQDIRESQEFSNDSDLRKTQLVKLLCKSPEEIDKISLYDRNYLFVIAVSSLTLNSLPFKAKCSNPECGKVLSDTIDITQLEVVFLENEAVCKKEVNGQEFTFRLLRVEDEIRAMDYANQVEKDYKDRLEDAYVCASLDMEINDENVNKVRNLDLSVYYLAQFYQICQSHGLVLSKKVKCKSCGNTTNVVMDVKGNMLNMDMSIIMDRYASLSDRIDYKSFLDMTLPEYNFLVDSLNTKHESR